VKTIRKIIVILVALCAICTTAHAAEDTENYVFIYGNEYYDMNRGCFVFTNSSMGSAQLCTNVAEGMVTTGPVCVEIPVGYTAMLYQDGFIRSDPDFGNITDPGNYTVCITNSGGAGNKILSFTIVNETCGTVEEYKMPQGFTIRSASLDSETFAKAGSSVAFADEGMYRIDYTCLATGVSYQLRVTVDHTAPVLELRNVENGIAKGPVDISDVEQGASLFIKHDGIEMDDPGSVLDETGDYYILLTDAAGNSTEYTFHIGVYFNLSSVGLLLLAVAAIAALVIYVVRVRRKTRVR